MKKTSFYAPELDSLRFLAFLLVLIHHSQYYEAIPLWATVSKYGWMGVDLFLCLSAFLFARLLFVEYQEKGDIHVGYFYLRRGLRIWPLYWFFFGLMLTLSIGENGWNPYLLKRSAGMLTFTDNLFSMSLGYNLALLYSAHLWTISYEEQFYLVIPWALRALYRMKKVTALSVLGALMLAGMLVRAAFIYFDVSHPAIWVFPFTHFESIFGGLMVGLGLFDEQLKKIPAWFLFLAGALALWGVTELPNVNVIQWELMLTYPLIGLGMALILASVMQGGLWPLSLLFKNKTLGYLGKISYGLYVYHLAGLDLAFEWTDTLVSPERLLVYPLAGTALGLAVTVAFSVASYELLEKPFLRIKERFAFIQTRPV
ncbi:MAG: acyltransferase family protein [Chloroflexota bacterium]